jgi:phosphohistidine phosphatase
MKRLFVLRHAEAERDSATGRDFDRPLAERGRDDARQLGREMGERGLTPDAVVASRAKRVVETLAAVAEGYGPLDADYDERIYDASPGTLLDVVRQADESAQALLLVGHNPGLQELLLDLADRDERGLRDRVRARYPTAALAVVELPARSWSELRPGGGEIVELIVPRDLAD